MRFAAFWSGIVAAGLGCAHISSAQDKMTVAELERRAEFHASTAEMFRRHDQLSQAKKFQELSDHYAEELGRRTQ